MADGTLIAVAKQQFFDINGKLIPGARLYSFLAGTTTPAPLYADSSLTVPLTNPAIADGSGRLTAYMPSNTTYKLELRTSADVTVWIQDGVQGVPSNEVDLDIQQVAGEALADRDVVFLSNGTGGTTVGRWYKADADIVARSTGANIVGIAPLAAGVGASTTIRLQGRLDGFTGLTPGAAYYISQVAGQLTSVAPPNARFIGIADTTTSLVMTIGGVAQAQPADPIFNSVQISSTNASALDVAGGIVAGTGNVQVVDATGKIPAIDATRFAILSGANLTGIPETAIADGTLLARLAANEIITGAWRFSEPIQVDNSTNSSLLLTHVGSGVVFRVQARADNTSLIQFLQNDLVTSEGAIQGVAGGLNLLAGSALATVLSLTSTGVALPLGERLTSVISPPQLTADVNNYNPAGLSTARIIRIDPDGGDGVHDITGLAAQPAGTVLTLTHVGVTGKFTVKAVSGSSLAANRFAMVADITCGAPVGGGSAGDRSSVSIWYDGTSNVWRTLD